MTQEPQFSNTLDRRGMLRLAVAASLGATLPAYSGTRPSPSAVAPHSKKGFCTTIKNPAWQARLSALDAKWFYSWSADVPEGIPAGVSFVPMIWGNPKDPQIIMQRAAAAKAAGIGDLLGFNEPEKKSQSNIRVEHALDAWPVLMETGMRLGSPGCVHADGDWMKEFMATADRRSLRVDFICVHSYHGPNADALVKRLEDIHRMFRRPIWITEFAVGDWQAESPQANRHKPDQVLRFMEAVLPSLEKLDFIERYAWFSAETESPALGTSSLFQPDGSLTRLGECYRDFQR